MKKDSFRRKSASGEGEIYSQCWIPHGEIKAVLQIAHGMSEHSGRYERIATLLAEAGYAVFANDHIGHGNSAMGHLGTLALQDGGFDFLVHDMKTLYDFAEEYLGRKDLPKILFGHSMGSIASANYAAKFGDLKALILMGTPAQNPMAPVGIWIGKLVAKIKGYEASSTLITNISGTKIDSDNLEDCWLTRNTDEIKKYLADPLRAKNFAASSFAEMLKGLQDWGEKDWPLKVLNIPVFITAGDKDPIGNCGKGPMSYYECLIKAGHQNCRIKLYEGARHEVLNEWQREEVENDLLQFLSDYEK